MTRTLERISFTTQRGADSNQSSISADGRYVVFTTRAANLVPEDTNNADDVFVFDRVTDTIIRVSVASDGAQANGASSTSLYSPYSITADGRYVTYSSEASNLVAGDTNNATDIFVCDLVTQTTERASIASNGTQGNSGSYGEAISADGRFVLFNSAASNLVDGDVNGKVDTFIYDRTTHTIEIISAGIAGPSDFFGGAISTDGRYSVFVASLGLPPSDFPTGFFLHDRGANTTEQIPISLPTNYRLYGEPSISGDGRYVVRAGSANLNRTISGVSA